MATTLWLVRHGERRDTVDPDWAATADRPHDPPLTDHGRWQAERVGRRLAGEDIDAVYASPFYRTVETACLVAAPLDLPVFVDHGLGEHLNPEWFETAPEILTRDSLAREFDRVSPAHESVLLPEFPETGTEAADRATEAVRRILEREAAGPVLVVGHGLTVGGVATGLTDVDHVETPLCGLCRLERTDRGWDLEFGPDTAHLE